MAWPSLILDNETNLYTPWIMKRTIIIFYALLWGGGFSRVCDMDLYMDLYMLSIVG